MTTKIYKIEEQIEAVSTKLNTVLRDFIHNSVEDSALLYFTKTELPVLTDEQILNYVELCKKTYQKTKLPVLTGRLHAQQTIDCGDNIVLLAGSILKQKIITLFITRDAIQAIGYFDERMTDNCCYGDYVHRLSNAGKYPRLNMRHLPWLFDVATEEKATGKNIMNEISCGWFNYKHGDFPQNKRYQEIDELKISLKNFIKGSKE
jgi:hypothetical protein